MRLFSCHYQGEPRWGIAEGRQLRLAPVTGDWPRDIGSLLADSSDPLARAARLNADGEGPLDWDDVAVRAPIPQPRQNIMCLGLNYAAHAAESMRAKGRTPEVPEHPVVFTKSTSSVAGPYDDVPLDPAITTELDWEVELAVVIGAHVHKADTTAARAGVFGYTVVNDLSARDIQFRHKQFFLGKSLERACPMGPTLVTADEIPDPQALGLRCHVNGAHKQEGHTGDQVFGVVEIVRRLSWVMTLAPGDVIATGTPDGVGFARTPPEFLDAGDEVVCEVDNLGTLNNRIIAA